MAGAGCARRVERGRVGFLNLPLVRWDSHDTGRTQRQDNHRDQAMVQAFRVLDENTPGVESTIQRRVSDMGTGTTG